MTKRRGAVTLGRPVDAAGDGPADAQPLLIHASAVRFLEKGVLLLGRSASGKSDLALRLIDAGGRLIADDQVGLRSTGDRLTAEAPARLAGLIELRGMGIMRVPHSPGLIDLAVDLDASDRDEDRLPEARTLSFCGIALPTIGLDAQAASAVARIRLALEVERVF